jgi:transmembrane sensor
MNTANRKEVPSREQVGEASAWMAVLRAPGRTSGVERGFQRWLAEKAGNKAAFEAVSTAWEETAGLPPIALKHSRSRRSDGFKQGFLQAAGAAAAIGLLAVGAFLYHQRHAGVATDIGEQRSLTLQDGSRVYLNTDTRVVVQYNHKVRKIELKQGEALFDVANVPGRPFVVLAGGREIQALGTAFVVRDDASRFMVTLVEGKVGIYDRLDSDRADTAQSSDHRPALVLSAGQRLTLAANQKPQLDKPVIEKVVAWRTGQVDLADVRLADAVAEMNRYTRTKVVIERPETAGLRITGIFRAGDIVSFANAIANTYGLKAQETDERIVISGAPSEALKPN